MPQTSAAGLIRRLGRGCPPLEQPLNASRLVELFTLADSGLAFVIAGFPFSGSTSLSAIVAAHPDVELPSEQLTWNVL